MNLLAIDTAADLCAACVFDTEAGGELGRSVLDLGKGHAEHLIGVIDTSLAAAGIGYADLGMIAVCVGPGSFTGVRVGVSTARGLALALGIPAAGVSSLEALAAEARADFPGHTQLTVLDAGRGGVYAAVYEPDGTAVHAPALLTIAEGGELARHGDPVLVGSGADAVMTAAGRQQTVASRSATADIATYARVAAARGLPGLPASPIYLRAADASPQSGFALPRKDRP
jgi:tRNA threonylcarbamoyladenosine biosynthesis protein TsaB